MLDVFLVKPLNSFNMDNLTIDFIHFATSGKMLKTSDFDTDAGIASLAISGMKRVSLELAGMASVEQSLYELNDEKVVYKKSDNRSNRRSFNGNKKMKENREDGVHIMYDSIGRKTESITYLNGLANGLHTLYYENGNKKAEGKDRDKCRVGSWIWYYESGEKWKEGNYSENRCNNREGIWTVWKKNGRKFTETVYKDGNFVSRKKY